MKIFSNFIFIALGLMISSALTHYMQVSAQTILIAALVIFILSVILSFITHNSSNITNTNQNKPQRKKSTPKTKAVATGPTVTGNVKWYNKTKGFGFITQEDGSDIFVHQSALAFKGGTLKDGQAVTMQVVIDEKNRPQAENVRRA